MHNKNIAISHLKLALKNVGNDSNTIDVRNNIRLAIRQLEHKNKKEKRKIETQTHYQKWWGQIVAGAQNAAQANQNVASQATVKSLQDLENLITDQQKILKALEIEVQNQTDGSQQTDTLLQD